MTKEFSMTNPEGLTLAEIRQEAYQQGREDLADELLAIKDPCDYCYMEFCESCNQRTEWEYKVKKRLEQINEQRNE